VHRLDEIHGVVIGNELQGVGNALNQVVLLDHGHESRSSKKRWGSYKLLASSGKLKQYADSLSLSLPLETCGS
jgi:hypothetical protein